MFHVWENMWQLELPEYKSQFIKQEIRNEEIQILETRSKLRVLRDRKEKSEKNQEFLEEEEESNHSEIFLEHIFFSLTKISLKGNCSTRA